MPQAKRMTIEYKDGTGEVWEPDGGWTPKPKPIEGPNIHDFLTAEAERYGRLIEALNELAPLSWPEAKWGFETSGGGLTHATASWVSPNGERYGWIAIDDNDGDVMIGAYWGLDLSNMAYETHQHEGRKIETLGPNELEYVIARARLAVAAINVRIHCGHAEIWTVSSDWHEDEEVMSNVIECIVCHRQATVMGTLVFNKPERGDWN